MCSWHLPVQFIPQDKGSIKIYILIRFHVFTLVNPEIKFQVCHGQHLQRISWFIIRVWNATDKYSQTLPNHWFERVSLHHQTRYSHFKHEKYLALTSRRWLCGALFYIKISSKSSQRQHWAPILMQNETTCNLRGDCVNTECGSPSAQ